MSDNVNGLSAQISTLSAIVSDKDGNLYLGDTYSNAIRKVSNNATHSVTTLAGASAYSFADGAGSAARFYNPYGITLDNEGNIIV